MKSIRSTECPVLLVAGPTGSGKSALALDLAEALRGVVINADSMQVYRELRVVTARPSVADEARAPHRLFGVLAAAERCSVGRWLRLARAEIESARDAGRLPIVVGGTGLYLKALVEGLADVPPVAAEVRAEAEALYGEIGPEAFCERLAQLDPHAAARLPATDRQRLLRAFEVVRATGRTLAEWQRGAPARPIGGCNLITLILLPAREVLYPALDIRFDAMLARGAVEEARALLTLGLDPGLPAMKALGVRELGAYLRGERTLQQASAAVKQATRRFAKRQITWLRHQVCPDIVLERRYSEVIEREALATVRQHLMAAR